MSDQTAQFCFNLSWYGGRITITDDNLWMIQLALDSVLTVSLQRNWTDLDPDTGSP